MLSKHSHNSQTQTHFHASPSLRLPPEYCAPRARQLPVQCLRTPSGCTSFSVCCSLLPARQCSDLRISLCQSVALRTKSHSPLLSKTNARSILVCLLMFNWAQLGGASRGQLGRRVHGHHYSKHAVQVNNVATAYIPPRRRQRTQQTDSVHAPDLITSESFTHDQIPRKFFYDPIRGDNLKLSPLISPCGSRHPGHSSSAPPTALIPRQPATPPVNIAAVTSGSRLGFIESFSVTEMERESPYSLSIPAEQSLRVLLHDCGER